jgi:DNA-directed RNA polymerase subunit beta'
MVKKYCFKNIAFNKRELKEVISHYYIKYGISKTNCLLDSLKDLGFYFATKASISLAIEDLKVPPNKKYLVQITHNEITITQLKKLKGSITDIERFQKVIDMWNQTNDDLKKEVVKHFKYHDSLNPIYMMAFSGARGNLSQVHQLVGMRGLMADPNGQILDVPIKSNFREGLKITDYIISSYGARKGIVDTAIKTADSGYLTRRLVDVAQHVIIREVDCKSRTGILIKDSSTNSSNLIGRLLTKKIETNFDSFINNSNEITRSFINTTNDLLCSDIIIKSPLTCISSRSICQKCYGWNLSQMNMVEIGEAIGIIAAQSIGEPGTQLTMRTFHTGGVISNESMIQIRTKYNGQIIFSHLLQVLPNRTIYGEETSQVDNTGQIYIIKRYTPIVKFKVLPNLLLFIFTKQIINNGDLLAEIELINKQSIHATTYIKSDLTGEIKYQNIRITLLDNLYSKIIKNGIIWVLHGNLIILPQNSLINIKKNYYLLKNNSILSIRITNKEKGLIKLSSLNKQLIIFNCSMLFEFSSIFKQDKSQKGVFYLFTRLGDFFKLICLKSKSQILKEQFAYRITSKYDLKLAGKFYFSQFNYLNLKKKGIVNYICGSKVLFIPIENYRINNKNINILQLKHNRYVDKNISLAPYLYTKNKGLILLNRSCANIKNIFIVSGELFKVSFSYNILIKYFPISECFYPGEILFFTMKIKSLTKINIYCLNKTSKLLYKLELFSQIIIQGAISKEKNYTRYLSIENKNQFFAKVKNDLLYQHNTVIVQLPNKFKFSLIRSYLKFFFLKCDIIYHFIIYYFQYYSSTHLSFCTKERLNLISNINKRNRINKVKINIIVTHNQFIEPYSYIAILTVSSDKLFLVNQLKLHSVKNERLLYTTTHSYISIDRILKPKKLSILGYISNKYFSSNNIRKTKQKILQARVGQPYFISKGTTMYIHHGDFIMKNKLICLLVYEKIVTGDIIQGLPKIEHILESRISKSTVQLATEPSLVIGNRINHMLLLNKQTIRIYSFKNINNQELRIGSFISIAQPLEIGSINPHRVLNIYFIYYLRLSNLYEAVCRSLVNIQILLVNSIQNVYKSQGITISDKHVELIIKQMSSKIQIVATIYTSKILPGEIINLQQIKYINMALKFEKQPIINYRPILFGVTRTSLLTESFISAASFQETTKILTNAASEGKIDWLRGLKENIIIGNLVPSGTGFNIFGTLRSLKLKENV